MDHQLLRHITAQVLFSYRDYGVRDDCLDLPSPSPTSMEENSREVALETVSSGRK